MTFRIIEGDCLAVMPTLEAASVDAVVCDPPFGLKFMGKQWMLDKGVDKYRKGKRKITDLCQHYGVTLSQAHDATADAVATAQVTRAIINRYPSLKSSTPSQLGPYQARVWEEYRRFLTSDGMRKIEKGWPIPERAA